MADIIINKEMLQEQMGDKAEEFMECLRIVEDIINNPDHYLGMHAVKYANI